MTDKEARNLIERNRSVFQFDPEMLEALDLAIKALEERPKGKWINRRVITDKRSFDMCVCSNCRTEFSWDAETGVSMDNYNTCPNCNADMRGEEE